LLLLGRVDKQEQGMKKQKEYYKPFVHHLSKSQEK
jgi:hypothetical protein